MNSKKGLFALFCFYPLTLWAKLSVITTTTDLAWAAKKIGGDLVQVEPLLTGVENPHFLDASPRFIRKVANADMVALVGLDLEVGWLPKVLERSGNAKVQRGGIGYCETGRSVTVLQRPVIQIDRSMGDVHAMGNPHFWLSPVALSEAATSMAETMGKLDPANLAKYMESAEKFKIEMDALVKKNQPKLAQWKGKPAQVIEYHQEFIYLFSTYGLNSLGSIEEKPGVLPSAGRLSRISDTAKAAGIKVAMAAPYNPLGILEKFQELSHIPLLITPTSVQTSGVYADYIALHDHMVEDLVKHLSQTKGS